MTDNRKAIYNKDHDKRVISTENGTWTPQRRVSHTPGCNRGYRWIQVDKEHGYREHEKTTTDKHASFAHSDPWQNVACACARKLDAIMIAFGPKVADEYVSKQFNRVV